MANTTQSEDVALFESIKNDDIDRVRLILSADGQKANAIDEFGTSALESAAFKGNLAVSEILVEKGADVNYHDHPHQYTPLMFAALSGNANLCRFLLEKGADSSRKNSVGRSASELAAFTGQHSCVSLINNFMPVDDIIKAAGLNKDEYPDDLIDGIQGICGSSNIHPVRIIFYIQSNPILIEKKESVIRLLEEIIERQMKQKDTNEVMAFKIHMSLRIMKEVIKWLNKEDGKRSSNDTLKKYTKHLLNCSDEEAHAEQLELLIRQAVKEFPFQQSTLFQTIVKTLASTKIGSDPSGVSVLRQTILGQKMVMDEVFCLTCGQNNARKRCSACKKVNYCSGDCQKLHWFAHKKHCDKV